MSENTFNEVSHFMGTNWLVQFVLQPILIFGVIFHLAMGLYLDMQNKKARSKKYAKQNQSGSATWMSRNMVITGIMVLLFLGLHFYDFWVHEIDVKYIQGDRSGLLYDGEGTMRYWHELHEKFHDPVRVGIYGLSFVFLSLHLLHGFQSAFQSVGFRHTKYTPIIKKLGNLYAIAIPLMFVVIAVYHYATQS